MFVVVDGDVKTVECGVWSVRREMIVSGVSLIFQGCACDVCVCVWGTMSSEFINRNYLYLHVARFPFLFLRLWTLRWRRR